MNQEKPSIAFFGGEPLGVPVLEELKACSITPALIVCSPDRKQGRDLQLTPPPVKVWAEKAGIPVFQPDLLHSPDTIKKLSSYNLFLVVSYARILPKDILNIPKYKTLNVHPSLLPKFRGPSPIRSTILTDERKTGVTIIELDEEMDHGPIVTQKEMIIAPEHWPLRGRELDEALARLGGALLASTLPDWISGTITPKEQDHDAATFTKKFQKADGEINLADDPYQNLLKIRAFDGNPGTFFYTEKNGKQIRVKITDAELDTDGSLKILRVIPEGKKEMDFEVLQRML